MKICVTGANGFLGQALCSSLLSRGHEVVRAVRRASRPGDVPVGEIGPYTNWRSALFYPPHGKGEPVDTVIHLAALVHVMDSRLKGEVDKFRAVNTEGTLNLARQAAKAGVRRFVYLSSIKVNGEETPFTGSMFSRQEERRAFSEDMPPAPQDAYAISKWEAEQGLMRIAHETGLEVAILRPPLVYGPGVKANFLALMRLVKLGVPLPLGAVENRRSLLYLGNFLDAIHLCMTHPSAMNQTYIVSDGEDISTPELIRMLAKHMHRKARLISLPRNWLEWAGTIAGKGAELQRLTGSLVADSSKIRRDLNWQPPFSLDKGLAETVRWYLSGRLEKEYRSNQGL